MFWRSRNTALVPAEREVAESPIITRPVPAAITAATGEENEVKAYLRTAKEIGFEPAQLLEARLLAFFRRSSIPIYPYQRVVEYLVTKAPRDSIVVWRPLRNIDKPSGWGWQGINGRHGHGHYWDEWPCRSYGHLVPLRVLATVEQIEREIGRNRLHFFVSDYASSRPDPFILVTARDMDRYVFDAWDEPGFTG